MAAALTSFACAVPAVDAVEDEASETRGLVVIERSASADAVQADSARAFAGFVNIPATVSAERAMKLLGLASEVPETGLCTSNAEDSARMPLSPIGQVEFVEAGEVAIEVKDTRTELAPRAFPAVADMISGLVYSTRTRAADPLPADALYSVKVSGGPSLNKLQLTGDAPKLLQGVFVNGVAFETLTDVAVDTPIRVQWDAGQPGDVVVIGVETSNAERQLLCGFADEAGAATVRSSVAGNGRLSLRRIRVHEFEDGAAPPAAGYSELRFDFALAKSVHFGS